MSKPHPYQRDQILSAWQAMNVKNLLPICGDGTPTDGTSGTGAGTSGPGATYVDYTNAIEYIQTGTLASPVWVIKGTQY